MLTNKEILLLSNLREDGRQSITNLSRKTKIPISTIYDKLKMYERDQVIKKYTPILDFTVLGYAVRITLLVRVAADQKIRAKEFFQKHKAVNTCYRVHTAYDFLVEALFKSLEEVQQFLDATDACMAVSAKEVYYLLEECKKEDFLAEPKYLEIAEVRL